MKNITKRMVEKPKRPASGHLVTWDKKMSGFGIRVSSSGTVSFLVRYWSKPRQKEQWETLGKPPELTLTKARKKAAEILNSALAGGDPVAEARAAEAARVAAEQAAAMEQRTADALTVNLLAGEWLKALPNKTTRRGRRISPRTVEQYESCMRVYILPLLGTHPVTQVTRRDVRSLMDAATEGGPYMGNRAVSVLSIFYSHLDSIEAVPPGFNPARRPPRNPETKRGEHASVRLSNAQEGRLVREIYSAMESDPVGATALLTLLETGRRLREVLGMRWDRLDLEAGTADLGATKGKAAGDVCYLPPRVCAAIKGMPPIVGNPYVFTGNGPHGRRMGLQSLWERVKVNAGLEELSPDLKGFHLHDLRHHRISEMLAAGVAPSLVAQQVGHTSLDQLATYTHIKVQDVAAVLSKLPSVPPAPAPKRHSLNRR